MGKVMILYQKKKLNKNNTELGIVFIISVLDMFTLSIHDT